MNNTLRISYIVFSILLWNCAATGTSVTPVQKSVEKKSSLSDDDIEECRLYQSYQYDYWKNRLDEVIPYNFYGFF